MTGLTPPQRRALTFLGDPGSAGHVTPRQLAKRMWPDSPGWQRRSRRYGRNEAGALGAAMPMKAASLLWRLEGMGLACLEDDNRWTITERGRRLLEQTDAQEAAR